MSDDQLPTAAPEGAAPSLLEQAVLSPRKTYRTLTSQTLAGAFPDGVPTETACLTAFAGVEGIGPSDPVEAALAVQLMAANARSLELQRRAWLDGVAPERMERLLHLADKSARTVAVLADSIKRYRSGGEQKVTVEHVTVNAGGQAVVGVVETQGGGRGRDAR